MSALTFQIFYYLSILAAVIASVWITRAIMARDQPDLHPWHQLKLENEFNAKKFPQGMSFADYQALERKIVEEIKNKIEIPLAANHKIAVNRYYARSPAHREQWSQDWNLSFEQVPDDPQGAIVLLHGASDSPYSMRALSELFCDFGYAAVVVRLPGNGTIPGELTRIRPDDWAAMVPMGIARARDLIGDGKPMLIGGYSTGATLAIDYVLTLMQGKEGHQISGLLLFSPAIDVSAAARFAAWDNFFSRFKAFRKFAWLSIWPEYDPFKYTSFAKRVVSVVRELTAHNMDRINDLKGSEVWKSFPPVITFQSVVDATVSVQSVFAFHEVLEQECNQLVLFDVNRQQGVAPFLDEDIGKIVDQAVDAKFDHCDVTVVRNESAASTKVAAFRYRPKNDNQEEVVNLGYQWPQFVVSLSHVAVPFPEDDPLYGAQTNMLSYNLNNFHVKSEKSVLLVPAEDINRIRYNPFFGFMAQRIKDFVKSL